jgi:hypothetical protein
MLLDVMSPYNNLMINTKMIKVFGLSTAAYFSVLSEILPRVVQKKYEELAGTGYFTVDRGYIELRCGLTVEEQLVADAGLARSGILITHPENPNMLSISMDAMFEILAEDDAKILDKIRKKAKTKKTDEAAAKRSGKISTFSAFASTLAHTPEVQEAYQLWITALIEGGKCAFSKTTVQLFHDAMTRYTSDPATQVEILKQAAASGYPNAEWIINSMQKKTGYQRSAATYSTTEQKQFTGVSEESF